MTIHGKTLGIPGGGQLASMLTEAAHLLGVKTHVYTPHEDDPALAIADYKTIASFEDEGEAFLKFASSVDAVTTEFESVPVKFLERLEEAGVPVRPGSNVLAVGQDRWNERNLFDRCDIPKPPTYLINRWSAITGPGIGMGKDIFPALLKTCRGGYDGKNQTRVSDINEVNREWQKFGSGLCVLQEIVPFKFECSILIARDVFGGAESYVPSVNEHADGILRRSICPSPLINHSLLRQARAYAYRIAEHMKLEGILALEMFATQDEKTEEWLLLANEIAPRPHNSYHHTIEACEVSQFEQLVRIALGEPVRKPNLRHSAMMENLIGSDIHRIPGLEGLPNVFPHHYRKAERVNRKMGHVTTLLS